MISLFILNVLANNASEINKLVNISFFIAYSLFASKTFIISDKNNLPLKVLN